MQAGVEQGAGRFTRTRTLGDGLHASRQPQRIVGVVTALEGTSDAMNTAAMFQEYFWGQPIQGRSVFATGPAIRRAANW